MPVRTRCARPARADRDFASFPPTTASGDRVAPQTEKGKTTAQTADPVDTPSGLDAPEIIDCVEDTAGEAIATIEMGVDQLPSIRLLIATATLDDRRRAEVRHLMHEALDRLLGR